MELRSRRSRSASSSSVNPLSLALVPNEGMLGMLGMDGIAGMDGMDGMFTFGLEKEAEDGILLAGTMETGGQPGKNHFPFAFSPWLSAASGGALSLESSSGVDSGS